MRRPPPDDRLSGCDGGGAHAKLLWREAFTRRTWCRRRGPVSLPYAVVISKTMNGCPPHVYRPSSDRERPGWTNVEVERSPFVGLIAGEGRLLFVRFVLVVWGSDQQLYFPVPAKKGKGGWRLDFKYMSWRSSLDGNLSFSSTS